MDLPLCGAFGTARTSSSVSSPTSSSKSDQARHAVAGELLVMIILGRFVPSIAVLRYLAIAVYLPFRATKRRSSCREPVEVEPVHGRTIRRRVRAEPAHLGLLVHVQDGLGGLLIGPGLLQRGSQVGI
jgi:hypothetical protein